MSFIHQSGGGTWSLDTSRLRLSEKFVQGLTGELRDTLDHVRKEGEDFLKSIVPVDTGALVNSAVGGTNQVVVYWRVALAPDPERPEANYGLFQNDGWTDRGGSFHEGHHYMERTELFAARLLHDMTLDTLARNGFTVAQSNLKAALNPLGVKEALKRGPMNGVHPLEYDRVRAAYLRAVTQERLTEGRAAYIQQRKEFNATQRKIRRDTTLRSDR
ncbi:MAG: hypothetical protein LC793_07070 [Thermomicrobia bacterium]|nr:hypothetical protein [Thermomicrobia bacterium]